MQQMARALVSGIESDYELNGLKLPVQRVALADEDVPPPFGTLYSRLAEHVKHFTPGIGGQLLEVGAQGV